MADITHLIEPIDDPAGDSAEFPGCKGMIPKLANGAYTRKVPGACAGCPKSKRQHKVWESANLIPLGVQDFQNGVGGYWFQTYDLPTETLAAVSVTRQQGGLTVTFTRNTSQTRPYGLAKDTFWAEDKTLPDGRHGCLVYLSPAQATATPADRLVTVAVTSSGRAYDPVTADIATHATLGWDATQTQALAAGGAILSLASVTVTDRAGQAHELAPYEARPATWSEWDKDKYWLASLSGNQAQLEVSPEWAADVLDVRVWLNSIRTRACFEEFIAHAGRIRENQRREATLVTLMQLTYTGMPNSPTLAVGNHPPVTELTYPVVSGGDTLVLEYGADCENPNSIPYLLTQEDPEFNPDDPEHNVRYPTKTFKAALSVFCEVTIGGASQLAGNAKVIAYPSSIPKGIAQGEHFTLRLLTPLDGLALAKVPGHEDEPITAKVALYLLAREPRVVPRDSLPLWCVRGEWENITDFDEPLITLLEPGRIPAGNWVEARELAETAPDSGVLAWRAADLRSRIYTAHYEGGFRSYLDLTGYDLAGVVAISLRYWRESTSAAAIPCGQRLCKHSRRDWQGVHGTSWGDGKWYCEKAPDLRARPDGQDWIDAYRPECYNQKCPFWAVDDSVSLEQDQAFYRQITRAMPWELEQAQEGYPNYSLRRWDATGLAALAECDMYMPGGRHPLHLWSWWTGGWPQRLAWQTEQGVEQIHSVGGFEWLKQNAAGGYPRLDDPASYPPFGPGGNTWTNRPGEYGVAPADEANDPHGLERMTVLCGGLDVDKYSGEVTGWHGKRQRYLAGYELWWPKIPGGYDHQEATPAAWSLSYEGGAGEHYTAIVVTRAGGGVLFANDSTPANQLLTKKYQLPKDHFFAFEKDGALTIYFSPKNATASAADREISIAVTTTAKTYTATLDLATDEQDGWDKACALALKTVTKFAVTGVGEVVVTTQATGPDQKPIKYTLTPYAEGQAPATWAAWDRMKYAVTSQDEEGATIKVSPEWAGDKITVALTLSTVDQHFQPYASADGTFQRGAWDARGLPVPVGDPKAKYKCRVLFKPGARLNRLAEADGYGGLVCGATYKSTSLADGTLTVALRHQLNWASSVNPDNPEQDVRTYWKQGGAPGGAALPPWARVRNYDCPQSTDGAGQNGQYIRRGMVIKYVDERLAGTKLYNRKFHISFAKACGHSQTDSMIPGEHESGRTMLAGAAFWQPFADPGELTQAITVTRAGGTVTLTPRQSIGVKQYGLAKDEYYDITGYDAQGRRGMWLFFSRLNGTADDADRNLDITITTFKGEATQTYHSAHNLVAGTAYSWDPQVVRITSTDNITALRSVVVTKADGSKVTLTAAPSRPATWAAWPVGQYWATGLGTATVDLQVSPEWQQDWLRVELTLAPWQGSEEAYLSYALGIHNNGALPIDDVEAFKEIYSHCDEVHVRDEGGAHAEYLLAKGAAALNGMAVEVWSDPAALDGECKVIVSGPDQNDQETPADEVLYFGANGELLLANDPDAGRCLIVRPPAIAARDSRALAREHNALITVIGRMLD